MIKAYNQPILAEHKKEWDQLPPSEKAEKIFGKRRKYEVTAGVSFVAACFFYASTSRFISDCNHRNSRLHFKEI